MLLGVHCTQDVATFVLVVRKFGFKFSYIDTKMMITFTKRTKRRSITQLAEMDGSRTLGIKRLIAMKTSPSLRHRIPPSTRLTPSYNAVSPLPLTRNSHKQPTPHISRLLS